MLVFLKKLQSWTKVLVFYVSGCPYQTVHPVRNFLQFSTPPPPPPQHCSAILKLEKKFWILVSNVVCGVGEGVGACVN